MGSRKKPGDPGFREEIRNPAADANKAAQKKAAAKPKKSSPTRAPEGSVNFPPAQEGLVNFPLSTPEPLPQSFVGPPERGQRRSTFKPLVDGKPTPTSFVEDIKAGIGPFLATVGVKSSLSGLGSKIAPLIKGTVPGKATQTLLTGAPGFVVNTATKTSFKKFATTAVQKRGLGQTAFNVVSAALVASIAGKAFGQSFIGTEETAQSVGFVKSIAYEQGYWTGDWSIFDRAVAEERQVYADPTVKEEIQSYLGPLAIIGGTDKFVDQGVSNLEMWDELANNRKAQQQSGQTNEQAEVVRQKKEDDQYLENIDYYNNERKKMVQWELDAKFEAKKASNALERQKRMEEARFWAEERDKQRKKEEEDRIAIAKFWAGYRKRQQKLQEESRPSKLNFGLL